MKEGVEQKAQSKNPEYREAWREMNGAKKK